MGLLDGRKALIFGVANDHSIAWGIAQALHGAGATVGFASVERLLERRVRPLADSIGATFVEACDVSVGRPDPGGHGEMGRRPRSARRPRPCRRVRAARGARGLVPRHRASGLRDGPRRFGVQPRGHVPRGDPGGPLRPGSAGPDALLLRGRTGRRNYNVMGVAKAALEASVRYLAADLGPDGVRVNAISAGPGPDPFRVRRPRLPKLYSTFAESPPAREHHHRGRRETALWLSSDLSTPVTGEVVYVDGGFNVMGVPLAGRLRPKPRAGRDERR